MSQAVGAPLHVARVNEPRVELNNTRVWAAIIGGQTVTQMRSPATSFSNSNWNFTIVPPSKSSILDRVVLFHAHVVFTFGGSTNPNADNLLQAGRDAPRAHTLARAISNLSIAMNGTTTSIELQQIISAMERVKSPLQWNRTFGSVYPDFLDNACLYGDMVGAANNPLGNYSDNAAQPARGSYMLDRAYNNTNTPTSSIQAYDLYEYVELPPLLFTGNGDGKLVEGGGLTHLDTFVIQTAMNQSLQRMWSHASSGLSPSTATITSLSVNFDQNPEVLLNWITPRVEVPIPHEIVYPYSSIVRYTTQMGSVAPNGTTSMPSNVIQFQSVPEYIYIFARRSDQDIFSTLDKTISTTDTFAVINSISLQFNNIAGILSQASPAHLYEMSLQNGLDMSWQEFRGYTQYLNSASPNTTRTIGTTGSLLCISPTKDFGLQGLADGSLGQFNFQVSSLVIQNQNQTDTIPFDMYIIAVYDGILTISHNSAITQIGVATREDIATAPEYDMSYNELQAVYGGGSFFSSLGNIIKKGHDFIKDKKLISKGLSLIPHPGAQIGSKVADVLGYGQGISAGDLIGGRKLSKKQMRRRLM